MYKGCFKALLILVFFTIIALSPPINAEEVVIFFDTLGKALQLVIEIPGEIRVNSSVQIKLYFTPIRDIDIEYITILIQGCGVSLNTDLYRKAFMRGEVTYTRTINIEPTREGYLEIGVKALYTYREDLLRYSDFGYFYTNATSVRTTLYSELIEKYNKLLVDYEKLRGELSQLINKHSELSEKYNKLLVEHDRLINEYEKLQRNYNTVLEHYNKISEDYNKLITEYNTLKNQNTIISTISAILLAALVILVVVKAKIWGLKRATPSAVDK